MPFAGGSYMLSQAEVADFVYNNYLTLCSTTDKSGGGTVFTTRAARASSTSREITTSLGTFEHYNPRYCGTFLMAARFYFLVAEMTHLQQVRQSPVRYCKRRVPLNNASL